MDYSAIIFGFMTTFIVPIISQSHFNSMTRQLIAILLATCAGFVNVAISGNFNLSDIAGSIGLSIIAAQAFYQSLNKTQLFSTIEKATDMKGVSK